jgi:hypothetical protein
VLEDGCRLLERAERRATKEARNQDFGYPIDHGYRVTFDVHVYLPVMHKIDLGTIMSGVGLGTLALNSSSDRLGMN